MQLKFDFIYTTIQKIIFFKCLFQTFYSWKILHWS